MPHGNHDGHHKHHHLQAPQNDNDYLAIMAQVIFESGLNWDVLEKKWPGIQEAFVQFDAEKVASFGDAEIRALAENHEIIRNHAKIEAVVHNARVMLEVAGEHGSFAAYLKALRGEGDDEFLKEAISKRFSYMGPTTVATFLYAIGELHW